jgi:single-stranded DNA-binding protein
MQRVNKLELTVTITDPGKLTFLEYNGDAATNSVVTFSFGEKKCRYMATAYKETAEQITKLEPGTEVIIEGALYQESYKDKTTGQFKVIDKIRINNIKKDQDSVENNNFKNVF